MFQLIRQLKAHGVMGLNQRNVHYIGKYNARHLYPLVDDKLRTKLLAHDFHVRVPGLIGTLNYQHDVKSMAALVDGQSSFVLKPSRGSGGRGIMVIERIEDGVYYKPNGAGVTREGLQRHASNILGGLFSLGGHTDVVIIEDRVISDPSFAHYSYEGIPDIRVIVFQGFPVMAMMRLATHESDGKANLHQGACGVGLNLSHGRALTGVQHNRTITKHPDTHANLADLQVKAWPLLMALAARCYDMTKLGYLGVDIVLDAEHGPLLLELNARPGLSIQIANKVGLAGRLEHIEQGRAPKGLSAEERAEYAMTTLATLSHRTKDAA